MPRRFVHPNLVAGLALFVVACAPTAPAAPPASQPAAAPPAAPAATPAPAAPAAPAAQPAAAPAPKAAGPSRVTIGVTETIEKVNPYADSVSLLYGVWCEVYGCLVGYDFAKGDYVGGLAESWKVENPTTWIFNLRKGVKWHDGSPLTSADVVHSFDRIKNDPDSRQQQNISPVSKVEAVDENTVRVTTKSPTSSLLDFFSDRLIITNKAQFDKFGPDVWKEKPLGTGPYMLKELLTNERVVITKNPNWWGGPVQGPDEVIYKVIREPEVRVTGLLNGELQLAQFIPPHMVERVKSNPNINVVPVDSIEIMFIAMSPKYKPWENKLLRQAVAYAIDRDAIIKNVLQGQARRLDGPIGPGQYGYDPNLQPKYTYNPDKARQLVAQAGFPSGLDVEFSTPVGRYTQDKEISEAVTPMLTAVGIRTKLLTPEWATLWDNVQKGNIPFYYMGRGSVLDPGLPLSQYFETGVSPRIGYSNPQLDALFQKERASFDPAERKKVLGELMSLLTEEAPAHFMWTEIQQWGIAKSFDYKPRPDGRIFANEIRVK